MSKAVRFITYIGILSGDGKIQFITSEDGKAEPGRRAMTFERHEARDKICELLDKGINNTVIVVAPQRATYNKIFNPNGTPGMYEDVMEELQRSGFKQWAKGTSVRLYFCRDALKSANDGTFTFFDYIGIPFQLAGQLYKATTYIDCVTGIVYSDNPKARQFVAKVLQDTVDRLHPSPAAGITDDPTSYDIPKEEQDNV